MERFFRELRRAYPILWAKQAALEPVLQAWQADPQRVRQLCGWRWTRDTLEALPANIQAIQARWIGIRVSQDLLELCEELCLAPSVWDAFPDSTQNAIRDVFVDSIGDGFEGKP